MRVQTFKFKFPGMRKEDDFIVYPRKNQDDPVMAQGDRTICAFDPKTKIGYLNYKGSKPKYGIHLAPILGAEKYEFPQEFVTKCLEYMPSSGDQIGGGVYLA